MARKLILLTGVALTSLSVIFADGSGSYQSAQGKDVSTSPCCMARNVTPPALCVNECSIGMELDAAFILWTAREPGLEYVAGSTVISGAPNLEQGTLAQPGFDLKPGFKVGLGVQTQHDNIELHVGYTWFQSTSNSAMTIFGSGGAVDGSALWNYEAVHASMHSELTLNNASSNWSLKFNAIDGMWQRAFWVSEWLQLTPMLGLKGAWISQNMNVTYEGVDANVGSYSIHQLSNNSVRFRGAGIRTGLTTGWYFTRCWSLQGLLALSTVYGEYTCNTVAGDTTSANINGVDMFNQNTTDTFYQVAPVLETTLMLQWETYFGDESEYRFLLNAGWEEQVWFAQSYFTDCGNINRGGNMSLQGFTLGARFDF